MKKVTGVLLLCVCAGCGMFSGVRAKSSSDDMPLGKPQAPQQAPPPPPQPVAESYAVIAYNQVGEGLSGADLDQQAGHMEAAGQKLKEVIRLAQEALTRIDRDKLSGGWLPGLKYKTQRDGILQEAELVRKLGDMRATAERQWSESVRPAVRAALQKRYKTVSEEQVDLLEREGKPRAMRRTGRDWCWEYEGERQIVTYCWSRRGEQERRLVRDK